MIYFRINCIYQEIIKNVTNYLTQYNIHILLNIKHYFILTINRLKQFLMQKSLKKTS